MARIAVVTGGTRGIGEAISVALKNAGYTVAANYAGNDDRAKAFSERTGIKAYKWDVADFDACAAGIKQVESELGPVEVIVNNAGITRDATMKKMNRKAWDEVLDTSLGGFYNVLKPLVMPMVRAKQGGRIVVLSSVSGVIGNRGQVNYSAAKAGLIGAAKALAVELASRGITVNCVAPGPIATDMLEGAPLEEMLKAIPMRRVGTPDEVAAVVGFLMADEAGYITRQVIGVNGGLA